MWHSYNIHAAIGLMGYGYMYTSFQFIMQASNKKLSIVQQMNIARDIGFGMEYLSALGFIHGVRLIMA